MTEVSLSSPALQHLRQLLQDANEDLVGDLGRMLQDVRQTTAGSMGARGGIYGGTGTNDRGELSRLITVLKQNTKDLTAYEKYLLLSARRQVSAMDKTAASADKSADSLDKNAESTDKNTRSQVDNTKEIERSTNETKSFIKSIVDGTFHMKGFSKVVEEFQSSYKLGFKWNPIVDSFNAALMGMDPKAMMDFQAEFRRVSNTMAGGYREFNSVIASSQWELKQFTGDMRSAAHLMGNLYEISHTIGIGADDISDSTDSMIQQFKRMQSITSITSDQFVELTRRITTNADVQQKLLGLNERERGNHVRNLINHQMHLQAIGLQKEAAERLIAASETRSTRPALERLQNRVQMSHVLHNVLKWSKEDAERTSILANKRGPLTEEERNYLSEQRLRMAEEAERFKRTGQGVGGVATQNEFLLDAIFEKLNLGDDFTMGREGALQRSAEANTTALLNQQQEIADRDSSLLGVIAQQATGIHDIMNGWAGTAIAGVAGAAVVTILNRFKLVERVTGLLRGRAAGAGGGAGGGPAGGGAGREGRGRRTLNYMRGMNIRGGVAGLATGVIANTALDPANFSAGNRHSAGIAQGALQYGGLGASLAMINPILGAVGGVAGALYGAYRGHVDFQRDFSTQMEINKEVHTRMLSVEESRLRQQRKALELRLNTLQSEQDLTIQHRDLIRSTKAELDDVSRKQDEAKVRQQAATLASGGMVLSQMMEQGIKLSNTKDLNTRMSSLDRVISMAGIQGDVRKDLLDNIGQRVLSSNAGPEAWEHLANLESAVTQGTKASIHPVLREHVEAALNDTLSGYSGRMGTLNTTSSSGDITGAWASTNADVLAKQEKVDALQREYDEMIHSGGPINIHSAAAKEREIKAARDALEHAKSTADVLWKASTGEVPLQVGLSADSLTDLSNAIKGKFSHSPAAATASPSFA